MSRPKSHHFVPRSYLARFADARGFLHLYELSSKSFRRQRPAEVMKINAYYRQEWAPPGTDPDILERGLGEWLENEAKGAIDKLMEDPGTLTEQEFAEFVVYLEVQRVRVPRQASSAMDLMKKKLHELAPPAAAAALNAGLVQIEMKKSARFDYLRWSIGAFTPWFESMEWEIISADPSAAFVTTDSPVSFYNPVAPPPAEAGIALAGTIVFFPLSSRKLLIMRHASRKSTDHDPVKILSDLGCKTESARIYFGITWPADVVDRFNWKMVRLSGDLVVAESREVLERCIGHGAV